MAATDAVSAIFSMPIPFTITSTYFAAATSSARKRWREDNKVYDFNNDDEDDVVTSGTPTLLQLSDPMASVSSSSLLLPLEASAIEIRSRRAHDTRRNLCLASLAATQAQSRICHGMSKASARFNLRPRRLGFGVEGQV